MSSEKRCLYEILGLKMDCSQEEIRSSYKKLALQLHPDKLMQTGVSEEEATSAFQELLHAYEVLSDPRERAWYDSHRSQILFSSASDVSSGRGSSYSSFSLDLFSLFSNSAFSGFGDSGKGFFRVYGDAFGKIYGQEGLFVKKLGLGLDLIKDAPLIGNLESPYSQVTAFYSYWIGFSTVMDFCWVDQYDVAAGPNRKSRRVMEEENKKLRKKAKRDYNDTVRGLAEFVKKRDKRVVEMQLKRNLEQEKRREEEKIRKKELERAKLERARLYEPPEWANVEGDDEDDDIADGFDESGDGKEKHGKEFYCVVCSKKFKSDKQWKNHEQSKKHREKVAELRVSFAEEEGEEEEEKDGVSGDDIDNGHAADDVDELRKEFEDGFGFREAQSEFNISVGDDKGIEDSDVNYREEGSNLLNTDEETSILEEMVSGHKSNKKAVGHQPDSSLFSKFHETDSDETSFMEYNTRKKTRRNRSKKKEDGVKSKAEAARSKKAESHEEMVSSSNGSNVQIEGDNTRDTSHLQEPSTCLFEETDTNSGMNQLLEKNNNSANQQVDRKGADKRDTNIRSKNLSKGKKKKATSKASTHSCETCGEDFDSRNKLYMHLGNTGHATLKS